MPSSVASLHHPARSATVQVATDPQKEKKLSVLESHGYFLGKTIGTGSYATVRLAESERHDGLVAIKIVSKFSAPADYLKKFLPREIEVVKGLRHPNLIRFLQAIETTHRVYIVMEYAENGSLLDIIRKDGHIDDTRARKWFRQLVDAVEYCHDRGVVHRDIKCENMLMNSEWTLKMSDFGFARGNLKDKNGQNVLSETFCGSYAYASPEILKGIPYQPQHADVWSMGVVLFAMVFGRLPFDDSNYKELIKQVSNKVTFPKEPKISSICKSLINKILAPLKSRIRISGIKIDPWFTFTQPDLSRARADSSDSTDDEPRVSIVSKDIPPPSLITKSQLEAAAKPKVTGRRSTLEETDILVRDPDIQSLQPYANTDTQDTKSGKNNKNDKHGNDKPKDKKK
ncbi:testis-specific serine/threonine-protein kinase 3-like [Diabrotica virgifera virgifera]|uniref:Testis-specific serine/threonine-protein kinase 3-like n=1 Tax=Diabrotica virgifera virgifera TaxID=50390 RepID=A0A6P7FF38_DIAVI|nr:testis-specific serine/threonine-protein kinase 3-like [Diabrotica virgifera virgifera]